MAHRNARLTFHGRRLLVERVVVEGQAVAHVAKAMGVSRQCGHRWVARFKTGGLAALHDRSSRPHSTPTRTAPRSKQPWSRLGSSIAVVRTGSAPSSASRPAPCQRILRRHDMPRLCELDPLTGTVIRASKTTAVRYERDRPGELVHMDVKKIGRIPDGGGWRAHGRQMGSTAARKRARIGFDYVHSLVDDHSRLAYSEIHPDEQGPTCAAFLTRAAAYFADHGITRIERVMTDNHWSYTRTQAVAAVITEPRRPPQAHQAALPLAERQGRTTQPHPADRVGLPAGVHHQRRTLSSPGTMARLLQPPTTPQRPRRPPTHQPPVTNLTSRRAESAVLAEVRHGERGGGELARPRRVTAASPAGSRISTSVTRYGSIAST